MKRILIAAALLLASPATAQQMIGPAFNYVPPTPPTPREAAVYRCFKPWDGKDRQVCVNSVPK